MINSDNATNENECDSFAHGTLQMTNEKHNDDFFNHTVKKNYCLRSTPTMVSLHWNTMSEVANLNANQQRIASTFIRQNFGNSTVESQQKREASFSDRVPHTKSILTENNNREVASWHINLNAMIVHDVSKFKKSILSDAK